MNLKIDEAWELGVEYVTFKPEKLVESEEKSDKTGIFKVLESNDFMGMLVHLHLHNFDSDLDKRILPTFQEKLEKNSYEGEELYETLEFLNQNVKWYFAILYKLTSEMTMKIQLKDNLEASIFSLIHSKKIMNYFIEFFRSSFNTFTEINKDDNSCKTESNKMLDLGLFGRFYIKPITIVLQSEIKRYIEEQCKYKYEEMWLNGVLESWLDKQVMPWVKTVIMAQNNETAWFSCEDMISNMEDNEVEFTTWKSKVTNILYESYTHMRIKEMFDIITDYPESSPAIKDLIICLDRTNQRPYLIDALKKDLPKRVLHPGVCTSDIITLYIPAVKVLRMLDPTGVVMEIVLEPCTKYLKMRDDAVKMIMTGLLDDENGINELASELAIGSDQENNSMIIGDNSESYLKEKLPNNPEDWKPDPREADPERSDKFRRTSDIISLLVGMYGTKDRFISEYQKLLSQRLLSTWFTESSEDSEIKNLELLKLRFGEDNMVKCAVMLKDVADSRRINTYVKDEYMETVANKSNVDVSAMILSSEFWPEIPVHELNLPKDVQDSLDIFQKGYDSHKASRTLKWMSNIGKVDLELELEDDRTLTFNHITPLLASIIYLFQDKSTWTLSEISNELKVPTTIIRRKISYWLQEGVLRENMEDVYMISVQSSSQYTGQNRSIAHHEDDDEEVAADSELKKQKEELVLWNYIKGMLMNFESLPIDKIHKMLRMFAMQDASIMMEQSKLNSLLQKRVQEGVLSFEQGQYKIVN